MSTYDPGRWRQGLFELRATMTWPILRRALYATVWSGMVHWLMAIGVVKSFGAIGHSLVGVAFGLLLVFRTNTSYDRFWEGRRLWGAMVEEFRNLARLAALDVQAERRREVQSLLSMFAHSLMHSLRGERGLGPHAEALSTPARKAIEASTHTLTACLTRASALVRTEWAGDAKATALLVTFEESARNLLMHAGGCHRIRSTPIPFPYTVHLRRALVAYAMTVPFAFANELGWISVPTTFLVTYILFGIEELGACIENPFGDDPSDLPLADYCAAIDAVLFDAALPAVATA